jgi:hypothetical protein
MKIDKNKLKEILDKVAGDQSCFFYALATPRLRELIAVGDDPTVNRMPQIYKTAFLEGRGIALDNNLIVKYVTGSADDDTKHVLGLCEIMLNAPLKIS